MPALPTILDLINEDIGDAEDRVATYGTPLTGAPRADFEASCDSASSNASDGMADSFFAGLTGSVLTYGGVEGEELDWWQSLTDEASTIVDLGSNATSQQRQTALNNLATMADATRLAELKAAYT